MVNNRNERAVSEVMGTILMVALVVILAAVIGSMVFGLVGIMKNPNLVGVSAVKFNTTHVLVTFTGGEKADQLYNLTVSMNGGSPQPMTQGTKSMTVGNSSFFSGATSGSDHLVIVGYFADGTQQVIMDTYL
ncbi:MAG: type IV pilin N-terminal domain-containing protein [Methanoregula sp.]|nr:MAG: type IV pilin N-terminal domain-containing protein [Methanoregula sp.]